MKILFVNDYSEKIGGAEIYMHTLQKELQDRGYNVEIFATAITKEEYSENQNKKDSLKVLRRIFNPAALGAFRKKVKQFQPDIIHIHGFSNELSPSILLGVGKTPVIMTVHNNMLVNAVSNLSERTGKECKTRTCGGCVNCLGLKGAMYETIKRNIHKQILKKISLYITPSVYMKELMEEAGFSPVQHIPNGFKLFDYSPITNYNKLLYVGRLSKEKGVDYLIRAIPTVLKSHPTAKLTIVGDGPEKENLLSLIDKLGIQKNITIHTAVKHEEIEKYYKDSTIVIVPSIYHDNLPTVCIEAISVGRPLIGTRMGGIPELIENNMTGILVDSKNSIQLAHSINLLLSDKNNLTKLSTAAHLKSKRFVLDTHIKLMADIYKDLLHK